MMGILRWIIYFEIMGKIDFPEIEVKNKKSAIPPIIKCIIASIAVSEKI
jgi:hypothetical protein